MAATRSYVVEPALAAYIAEHSTAPDHVQQRLMNATEERTGGAARMQIGNDQGSFFEMLVRAMGVRSAIEIGTFTGYSAMSIARGLAPGGSLICCDVSEEWTRIAQEHWALAGVADRIDLRIAPALDTLAALPADQLFDLAFIDADKPGYIEYYEQIVQRLRPNGVILVDNVLFHGSVIDPDAHDESAQGIRAFNDHVMADPRVECVMLAIGDGLTFIRRRG